MYNNTGHRCVATRCISVYCSPGRAYYTHCTVGAKPPGTGSPTTTTLTKYFPCTSIDFGGLHFPVFTFVLFLKHFLTFLWLYWWDSFWDDQLPSSTNWANCCKLRAQILEPVTSTSHLQRCQFLMQWHTPIFSHLGSLQISALWDPLSAILRLSFNHQPHNS